MQVSLAYRGAPLADGAAGLVGVAEHGVLGRRWVYDGAQDPVVVAQLLELLCGRAVAQHQDRGDTADRPVLRQWHGAGSLRPSSPASVSHARPGVTAGAVAGSRDRTPAGLCLEVVRVLSGPGAAAARSSPRSVLGFVEAGWQRPDGTGVRARSPPFTDAVRWRRSVSYWAVPGLARTTRGPAPDLLRAGRAGTDQPRRGGPLAGGV